MFYVGARGIMHDGSVAAQVGLKNLKFRYSINGDSVPWHLLFAYDDARQIYIEFPIGITERKLPLLFFIGANSRGKWLANYRFPRVVQDFLIVDRLFVAVELELNDGRKTKTVRIERNNGKNDDEDDR